MALVKQPSKVPVRKIQSGTLFATLFVILDWLDEKFWGNNIPEHVEEALLIVVFAIAAYFTKSKSSEV